MCAFKVPFVRLENKEQVERIKSEMLEVCLKAYQIHDIDCNQKYDIYPYSHHLKSVVDLACKYAIGNVETENDLRVVIFGAAFHDSIEDARLTYNDVMRYAKHFLGDEYMAHDATEIVYALTNEKGRTRDERANNKYYSGILATHFALFVKLCDRMANMQYSFDTKSSMMKKYLRENEEFCVCLGLPYFKKNYPISDEMMNDFKQLVNQIKESVENG